MKIIILVLLALVSPNLASVALGNLAVVIKPDGLISTYDNPLRAQTTDLWCQASSDEIQDISWGRFIRHKDRKIYEATIDKEEKQARLVFGEAPVTDAGKYRCEIRTLSGELVYGNMFAYSRPVAHTNASIFPVKISDHDPLLVEAPETSSSLGDTVTLTCPIIGFPLPSIVWYKDLLPLESEGRITIGKDSLTIEEVVQEDAGVYKCVATNQFPMVVDGAEQQFELKMEQSLTISVPIRKDQSEPIQINPEIQIESETDDIAGDESEIGYYGWLIPLIVIIIIIILLFITIYTCQAVKRYKADQYNVARHEQNIRRSEEHSLTKNEV